jgi:uncharacterized membrane protein YqjE
MPDPQAAGPLGSARALGASVLALMRVRLELAAVELKEGAERSKRQFILALVAAVFLASSLLLAAFLVVVVFWDSHRLAAAAGVTLAYFAIGMGAFLNFRATAVNSPPPFSATLEEFQKDLDLLRGRDEQG